MPRFSRIFIESNDSRRHRLDEASAYEGLAEARRMEASETDDPARRAQLLRRAKDAAKEAKAIRRGRR